MANLSPGIGTMNNQILDEITEDFSQWGDVYVQACLLLGLGGSPRGRDSQGLGNRDCIWILYT